VCELFPSLLIFPMWPHGECMSDHGPASFPGPWAPYSREVGSVQKPKIEGNRCACDSRSNHVTCV
jgi:hypothetical protein